jgi:two-component system sensor histidine kinase SenX3
MATTVAILAGLVVGVAIGWWLRRDRGAAVPSDAASTPAASAPAQAVADPVPALLRDAVDHLEIGVVVAGGDHAVLYRNAAAQRFRGTHIGALLDTKVTSLIAEVAGAERSAELVELHGPPKTWMALTADPVPGGGVVVTMQDVSERVRTDAMRTDFVTNISHELKTPVGAVAVLAEALHDESDPEVVKRLSDHLVDESHRAVRTIDDLLKLSTIESTRRDDTIVDVANVVDAAVSRGKVVDGGRGVEITTFTTAMPIRIRADERQLVSAVGNLVENAVKYSRAGDVVQVRTRVDGNAVEIMVADQGIGIPTRDLDRVFERFYRVDKARSRETGGTGLGLAIVRHVATNHGGEVLVSSQEGEGSTFVLRLPADLVVEETWTVGDDRDELVEMADTTTHPEDGG